MEVQSAEVNTKKITKSILNFVKKKSIKIISMDQFRIGNAKDIVGFRKLKNAVEEEFENLGMLDIPYYEIEKELRIVVQETIEKQNTSPNTGFIDQLEKTKKIKIAKQFKDGFELVQEKVNEEVNRRLQQYFFCENPNGKGYIIAEDPDNKGVLVQDEVPCSLEIFKAAFIDKYEPIEGKKVSLFDLWKARNLIVGVETYVPHGPCLIERYLTGVKMLNTWKAPPWYKFKEEIENRKLILETVNPILRCFLLHLLPDEAQRNWVLNWIRCSREKKLSTYLTMIAKSGIGKGILFNLIRKFHGETNTGEATNSLIEGRFNSIVKSKTIILLDEMQLMSQAAYNNIKRFANEITAIEGKGINAKEERIYANFVWTANDVNSMRALAPDDRRFSIPDLALHSLIDPITKHELVFIDPVLKSQGNTKNKVVFTKSLCDYLYRDEEIAEEFIGLLLGIEPDFKRAETALTDTENCKKIRMESRPDWVKELIDTLQTLDLTKSVGLEGLGSKDIQMLSMEARYTYLVKCAAIERVLYDLKKRYKITWRNLQHEISRMSSDQVNIAPLIGGKFDLYILHPKNYELKKGYFNVSSEIDSIEDAQEFSTKRPENTSKNSKRARK